MGPLERRSTRVSDNEDADTSTGNPDIRVPEGIESEDGLRARDAKRSEDADGGAERRSERPEDPEKRRQNEETQKTSDQGELDIRRGSEGREIRHVPGERPLTQLSLKDDMEKASLKVAFQGQTFKKEPE
ncbi:hypothetical protein NDU88_005393 [Pleurodeles waltl]|uniref:Uncharacterized protein n=1 Tax=Pleurodeles waltl TaxID=8319 RepID=A0AAV7WV31_PLEWA|nr:hypothetical protein NDU88_005393 [Pleurodeles waltl]